MEKIVVLLVGSQGSGKTTFCQQRLADHFRISQDEQGQHAHLEIYQKALKRSEPRIVIDRINALKPQRKRYLESAREHGYVTKIIWLNADRDECIRRCREREDHPTLKPDAVERAIANYYRAFQIPTRREADELEIHGPPPTFVPVLDIREYLKDRRYVIVGDVHGCLDELQTLLKKMQFNAEEDVLISVGDIVDRGPKIRETINFCRELPHFFMVLGNHEHKLIRYLRGNPVGTSGGLQQTIDSFDNEMPEDLLPWLESLPLILRTPAGYVVHAGFDPEMTPEEQNEEDCLYVRHYGGRTYFDEINGQLWHELWPTDWPRVFFGHIPTENGPYAKHVTGLDGGLVFGGELRLFDSEDGGIYKIQARKAYTASSHADVSSLTPLETLARRDEYVERGLLRGDKTDDGKLAIYTYTDACTYESAWDEITRYSRGHVFHTETGECIAWAFPKFFNLGENRETMAENYPWDEPYEIYEKMDGWLGVLYRHEGQCKIATRGSFHADGAQWATKHLQQFDLSHLPDEVTLCFEIISPEQRIILDYGDQRDLVILGAFNRHTGEEYLRPQVEEWARLTGLSIVPQLGRLSLDELLLYQKENETAEGMVIRFHDGRRVKVKTEWYLGIARILTNLSPISVWEVMTEGKVPMDYLQQIPEELRDLAERYCATLERQYAQIRNEIEAIARPLVEQFGYDRRALALEMEKRKSELGQRRSAVFLILDGKDERLDEMIKRLIYPRGNQFVKNPPQPDAQARDKETTA